jgi:hypothetical protein
MSSGNTPPAIQECQKLKTPSEKVKCLMQILDGTYDKPKTLPHSEIGVKPSNTNFPSISKAEMEKYVESQEPNPKRQIVSEEPVNLENLGVPDKITIEELRRQQINMHQYAC